VSDELPPFRPGEERSAWLLLRNETELRSRLERMRAGIAHPAFERLLDGLARPDEARARIQALAGHLEEALRTLGGLRGDLTRPEQGSGGGGIRPPEGGEALPPGLPETVDRLLRERARSPGFSYTVGQDPVRGWAVRWQERSEDGSIYASGRLYQRPWEWMRSNPVSG
jgi:hypothetical protein